MTSKLFAQFIQVIMILVSTVSGISQVDNIEDLLRGGIDDANILLNEYLAPAGKGFGTNLNNGWYYTARSHKLFGFDIMLMGSATIVPNSDVSFNLNELGLTHIRPLNVNNSDSPTIVGSDTNGPDIEIFAENPLIPGGETILGTLSMPQGIGYRYVPSPMLQASLNIFKNMEIMLRYIPEIEFSDDYGKVKMFGLGFKYRLNELISPEEALPVDMALMAAFTNLSAEADLEVNPDPGLPQTGASYESQIVAFDAGSFTVNFIASRTFKPLTLFTSLGYEKADVNIDLLGNYPITIVDDDSNSPDYGELVIRDFTDPVALSFNSPNTMRFCAGFHLRLAIIALHGSYTLAKYPGVNVGIGISIR